MSSRGDTLLATGRLALRRFTPQDAENLYTLDNDPGVMRYLNGGAPVSLEVIQPIFVTIYP